MNVGLYGGTFSPPHTAHVRAAKLFCREADLQLLYVMPAGIPPHKTQDRWGKADMRFEMARIAFDGVGTVSDYEIKKEGRSYTVETLRYLREKHPDDRLYMLVGEDMFFSLDTWKDPDVIMSICTVVAMRRENTLLCEMESRAFEYEKKYGANIIIIEADPIEVSSSLIRERIERGDSIEGIVPDGVRKYIEINGLYRDER